MELVALKCPKCGGELEVHEGQKKTFCKYCGSQILLDDGNRIINVIDEARLKEIKLNKEVSDFDQTFVTRRRAADTRTLHRSRGG